MEESNRNREVDSVIHLIDVSSEDDSLISSSGNNQEEEDVLQLPLRLRQAERSRKCNLRKSLAWDKAFFTNAGVLEPEELSIINSGLNKSSSSSSSSSSLSRIQEDVLRTSADSNSTLENLEAGLFDDIRASIQFSSPPQSSSKVSLKNKVTSAKKQTINTQQGVQSKVADKNKREPLVRPHPQVTTKSGELKQSLLRPPKMAGKMNPVTVSPTKRASLGIKSEIRNGKSVIGKKEEAKKSVSSSVSGIKMESAASCSDSLRKKTNVSSLKPPLRSSVHVIKSVSKLSPSVSAASSQDSFSSTNQHPIRKVLPNPSPKRNSADFKPTGLRMPSPKIGYFDAEKSTQVRSGLPKHGVGGRVTTSKIGSGVRKTPSRSLEVASATKTIPVTAEGQREKENSRCYENQVDIIDSKAGELTARKQDDLFLSTDDTRMRTPLAVKCNETEDSSTADQPVSTSVQSDET